ncbi:hypothetical protein predicted by Glimmer/Critica [Acetobacter ghanensis]|uniref:Uncharacterized protein n=1 Tax=Acetobacter ghanensis TaxID=431306 RepID=A0A0U5F6F8_9PROT|nr:hypothetical protein predicted by Glimmer/Critica [Acetobacter ghanensis]
MAQLCWYFSALLVALPATLLFRIIVIRFGRRLWLQAFRYWQFHLSQYLHFQKLLRAINYHSQLLLTPS